MWSKGGRGRVAIVRTVRLVAQLYPLPDCRARLESLTDVDFFASFVVTFQRPTSCRSTAQI